MASRPPSHSLAPETRGSVPSDHFSSKRRRVDEQHGIPMLELGKKLEGCHDEEARRKMLLDTYALYQAVHLSNDTLQSKQALKESSFSWKDIEKIYQALNQEDKDSWCIENGGNNLSPNEFLSAASSSCNSGYCSFLVQKDKPKLEELLDRIPLGSVPWTKWNYGSCVWFFFGLNAKENRHNLEGRPEHTDSVSHDGTMHYQLSGLKRWLLRPTKELLELIRRHQPDSKITNTSTFQVDCREGDVLVVNTRLWWHRTVIPPQSCPSVSYARDFYVNNNTEATEPKESMSNVDGLYAAEDIEEGTILFSENDMPDCELHRSSTDPNCEVVELEDGSSAVVTRRNIAAGEFFCVAESDGEDEFYEEDETGNEATATM